MTIDTYLYLFAKLVYINPIACLSLQYLTTVIPYHAHNGPPTNPNLQVLIKSKINIYLLNNAYLNYVNNVIKFLIILQNVFPPSPQGNRTR